MVCLVFQTQRLSCVTDIDRTAAVTTATNFSDNQVTTSYSTIGVGNKHFNCLLLMTHISLLREHLLILFSFSGCYHMMLII